jgi:hypothetical protein
MRHSGRADSLKRLAFAAPWDAARLQVIAIAETRGCVAIINESDGRQLMARRTARARILTTLDLLKLESATGRVTEPDARPLYTRMRDEQYRGPD